VPRPPSPSPPPPPRQDIELDAEMDLPLWLATELRGHNFIDVRLPRAFSKRLREGLRADPRAVALRDRSPHFYEVGLRMADLVPTEDTETLPTDIQATLAIRMQCVAKRGRGDAVKGHRPGPVGRRGRSFPPTPPPPSAVLLPRPCPSPACRDILEAAPQSLGKDVSRYRGGLTDAEAAVYDGARMHAALRMRWRRRQAEALDAAAALAPARVVAAAALPQSRGQKRDRSLLATTGT
jgi:hypothetical protein